MGIFNGTHWLVVPNHWDERDYANPSTIPKTRCGHCGDLVTAEIIATHRQEGGMVDGPVGPYRLFIETVWLLCPGCGRGSVVVNRDQYPSPELGAPAPNLPHDVERAYSEARRAFGASCYTASELICRTLLVHLAVATRSAEWERNKSFATYIDALDAEGHLTKAMKRWAHEIRKNANEATHELTEVTEERASATLRFTELLLRNLFEMGDFDLVEVKE